MKKRMQVIFAALCAVALVAAFALVGCASNSTGSSASSASGSAAASGEPVELTIFAANSLQKALPEVEALYTKQNPNVTFVESDTGFAASGTLVETLTADPTAADALITASTSSMDDAEAAKLVDTATRADMFTNDLVIAVSDDSKLTISDVKDIETNDAIKNVYMGKPSAVPAGNYALQTLVSAGLAEGDKASYTFADSIASKMNDGADKVGTVATYVAEDADGIGFVYTSDIYRYSGIKVAYTVPSDMHKNIVYPGAVCANSAHSDVAADFLDFCMNDAEAQAIFANYGFELAA